MKNKGFDKFQKTVDRLVEEWGGPPVGPEPQRIDPKMQTVSEWAKENRYILPPNHDIVMGEPRTGIAQTKKRSDKMHTVEIRKVNLGFIVNVGCRVFVFTDEKAMFHAISEYHTDPKAAEKRYCTEAPDEP